MDRRCHRTPSVLVVVLVVTVVVIVVRTRHEHARVYPGTGTKQKWVSASELTPSGPTCLKKTYACCPRVQDPGDSLGELNQPQGEEKGCLARWPQSRILRIREDATFPIALALEALDPAWQVPGIRLPG